MHLNSSYLYFERGLDQCQWERQREEPEENLELDPKAAHADVDQSLQNNAKVSVTDVLLMREMKYCIHHESTLHDISDVFSVVFDMVMCSLMSQTKAQRSLEMQCPLIGTPGGDYKGNQ